LAKGTDRGRRQRFVGFQATLTDTNTTGEALSRWTVVFSQPGAQSISGSQTGLAVAQQMAGSNAVGHIGQQDRHVRLGHSSFGDPNPVRAILGPV
jgi:hypothetical protein